MSTTAQALLNIMTVRLGMQEDGTTHPHPSVARATKQLVSRLSALTPEEEIEISYQVDPFHAKYICVRTSEVLAEIDYTHAV